MSAAGAREVSPARASAAVIGLGNMGGGIARNLARAGLLGGVWDSDESARARFGEAALAAPLPVLAARCEFLLFAVPTTAQVEEGLEGVALPAGRVVIDLTTSAPEAGRALAARLARAGVGYLDAPMTGGAAGAEAGTLTLMAGGQAELLARAEPVLAAIAGRVFHMGPVGAGHAMKLVHNMILHSAFLATCEGVRLAERAGLDPARAVEVLNAGNARSYVTETRFPRDILSGTMRARSTIANLEKDLGLAVEFGAGLGAPMPFARLAHELLAGAVAEGQGATDFAWLYPFYEGLARMALEGEER